jgi:hypothetical protein
MLAPRFKTGVGSTPYLRNANVQWDRLDLSDVYEMDFTNEERSEFALDVAWRLNPRPSIQSLGPVSILLMALVGTSCGAAAIGLFRWVL